MSIVKNGRLTLRFDDKSLKNAIKRIAINNKRSLNNEIMIAIREYVEKFENKNKST